MKLGGEGSDMVSTYNNTASDYVTFAMNTGQWGYVADELKLLTMEYTCVRSVALTVESACYVRLLGLWS